MPKVEYTPTKGLFQTSGNGIELTQGTNLQQTLSIKVLEELVTLSGTTSDTTATLPAGAIVIGGGIQTITGDTSNIDITDVGHAGDDDYYSGTIAHDAQNAGSALNITPILLIPSTVARAVRLTHGSATGDGQVRVTLYYLSVA